MLDRKLVKDKINRLRWRHEWLNYKMSSNKLSSVLSKFREVVEALGLVQTPVWTLLEIQTGLAILAMHLATLATTLTLRLTELIALATIHLSTDLYQITWKHEGRQTLLIEVPRGQLDLVAIMLELIAFCRLTTCLPIYEANKFHNLESPQQVDVKMEHLAAMDLTTGFLLILVCPSSNLPFKIAVHQAHVCTQMFSQGYLIRPQGWPATDPSPLTIYRPSEELVLR